MNKDIIKYFIDRVIRVNRGGPESRIGKVMDVGDDFIVLLTEEDGVVYYNTNQIKSFTENMKGQMEFNIEVPNDFEFKNAANFQDLLDSLKFQWVKINRGGPEKIEGVLSDITKDFVSLVNKEEIVRLSIFHIKNISFGVKIEKEDEEKSNNQASSKTGSQETNQSKMAESKKQESRQKVVKSNNNSRNKKNKTKN
ncbi:hypothetical protein ACIFOT_19790 [Neobacillus sp. NRS-1170]|uniref:hypothetical protein n=1 Tax=Neobacillus sp. NRS-1170 TaxID=3233898 RepID=UPI003D270C1D